MSALGNPADDGTVAAIAHALLAGAVDAAQGRHVEVESVGWSAEGVSWWADTVARLAGTSCPHVSDPGAVVTGEAWGHGLRCSACPVPDADEAPPSCDRCGTADLSESGTWGGFVQRGRVVLAVILCPGCFAAIGGTSAVGS